MIDSSVPWMRSPPAAPRRRWTQSARAFVSRTVSLSFVTQPTPADLRDALLVGLRTRRPLRRRDSELAFERHQLLAIRFQAGARLNDCGKAKERERWRIYFRQYFPRGGGQADLLWSRWRKPLLRNEPAGPGVIVTHGRPEAHWQLGVLAEGKGLVIDLESMWDDFEQSVESFVAACRSDERLAGRAVRRWSRRSRGDRAALARPPAPRLSTFHPAATATSPHQVVYTLPGDVDRIGEV